MDTKKTLIALAAGFVILAFIPASWAGETRIPLEAAKPTSKCQWNSLSEWG